MECGEKPERLLRALDQEDVGFMKTTEAIIGFYAQRIERAPDDENGTLMYFLRLHTETCQVLSPCFCKRTCCFHQAYSPPPTPGSLWNHHLIRGLFLVVPLVLHLGLARSLPIATAGPAMFPCVSHSQNLLKTVSHALQKAKQTLEFYSCTSEEIDHEDITKDRTSTVEACLPLELATNESCLVSRGISLITNGSCLASRKASFMTTLCLSSLYEDLKMYQVEFKAINAKLLMDPKRQITLDQNMLAAIDELMQALNFNSEAVPQKPSLEELDFYKTKVKLCILLHAFRIRAVTIDRMMSYLSSS
ncbi:PREDICTED: interleukin-12 subunit alpha [Miniopterus natalensis]|uniref:interleukin-12 subunit alpha n=1 Tax=Miniopterus natalensis TaxID=291302 RepID=UPI0007A6F566|nr:PREDICTED: interleukin-12 subunit alpha [Miniopterus natalensis]